MNSRKVLSHHTVTVWKQLQFTRFVFVFFDTKRLFLFFDTSLPQGFSGGWGRWLFVPSDSLCPEILCKHSMHIHTVNIFIYVYYIYIFIYISIEHDALQVMAVLSHTRTHFVPRTKVFFRHKRQLHCFLTFQICVFFFVFPKKRTTPST